jgi:WD40 repeat protein
VGTVHKARQLALNRLVAIKTLHRQTPAGLARFRTEAKAVARLQHPHIIQVIEVGESQGQAYLVLEYLDGGTLGQRIARGLAPARESAALVVQLARALQHAHQNGVIHRDLKPANILLAADGAPKIGDFGLAKQLDSDTLQTRTGEALGTPGYMAPEQVEGRSDLDWRVDVYALGAVLYELLTGRPPFNAATAADTMHQVLHDEPIPVVKLRPTVPVDLGTIAQKCLEKEPPKRYASALALAEDLERFLSNEPIAARPPSAIYRWRKFVRRNKAMVWGMVGIMVALLLGLIISTLFAFGEARQRNLAETARRTALRQAYQGRLAAALAVIGDHDILEAARQLQAAPEELRGWEWRHLHSLLDDSLYTVRMIDGHAGRVAFCPAGAKLLTSVNGGVRLLDARSGAELGELAKGGAQGVIACPTRGGFLTFIDYAAKGPVHQVDLSGNVLREFKPIGKERLWTAAVSPDGDRLAVYWYEGDSKDPILVYDLRSRQPPAQLLGHKTWIYSLAFSPDGTKLVCGSEDRTVCVWDIAKLTRLAILQGHTGVVRTVAVSPDGRRILSCSDDQTIRQWDMLTGNPLETFLGHVGGVSSVAYSPDGLRIVSGGKDETVRLWSSAGGGALAVLHGHEAQVTKVEFSPDGNELASAGLDDTARIWDAGTQADPHVLRGHNSYVYPVAYSPDGRWIASGGWGDKLIRLWDAATGEQAAALAGHEAFVAALAFSPDNKTLASASADSTIRTWDMTTGQMRTLAPLARKNAPNLRVMIGISPDGRTLAATLDERVIFWDLETGKETGQLVLPAAALRIVVFSPDGARLAVAGREPEFLLVDAKDGRVLTSFAGHTAEVHSLAFSPDGSWLISASEDKTACVWNAQSGQRLQVFRGHADVVFSAILHPDGSRIVSGGHDRVIRIWDPASGEEMARLPGHTNYVFSLAFSPDGSTLVSGSGDGTVRLWETERVARRLLARREQEQLRPEAKRLVERLMRQLEEPQRVAEQLHNDRTLPPALRHAAENELMRGVNH